MIDHKHPKRFGSMMLLVATSTLLACSQPNSNTTANTTEAASATEPTSVQTLSVETVDVSNSSNSASGSTILQNVSATVYKDVNCGCCKEWIAHAEGHGMSATAQDVTDLALFKERYSVPNNMRSCHTAVTTDGYVFEGHVPAKYVAQFLANPPSEAIGLAVPGMPMGSPGMEYQNKFDPYQVMQVNKDGTSEVYADIESPQQQL